MKFNIVSAGRQHQEQNPKQNNDLQSEFKKLSAAEKHKFLDNIDAKSKERVARKLFEEKIATAKEEGESTVTLIGGSGRNPMVVPVPGRSQFIITDTLLNRFRAECGMSGNKAIQVANVIVDESGGSAQKGKNLRHKLIEQNKNLESFFTWANLEFKCEAIEDANPDSHIPRDYDPNFEEGNEETENNGLYMRPVVYCNNVTGLIEYLKSKRELDDSCSLQVGIDGGGGNSLIVL